MDESNSKRIVPPPEINLVQNYQQLLSALLFYFQRRAETKNLHPTKEERRNLVKCGLVYNLISTPEQGGEHVRVLARYRIITPAIIPGQKGSFLSMAQIYILGIYLIEKPKDLNGNSLHVWLNTFSREVRRGKYETVDHVQKFIETYFFPSES